MLVLWLVSLSNIVDPPPRLGVSPLLSSVKPMCCGSPKERFFAKSSGCILEVDEMKLWPELTLVDSFATGHFKSVVLFFSEIVATRMAATMRSIW